MMAALARKAGSIKICRQHVHLQVFCLISQHGVDQIEEFERADRVEAHCGSDHRFDERKRDITECLRLCGTVNVRCFIQRFTDARNLRHVEHHGLAYILPEGDKSDHPHRQGDKSRGRIQPGGSFNAEIGEKVVDTDFGMKQECPQKSEGCGRKYAGHIDYVFEKISSLLDIRQESCQQKAHDQLGDAGEKKEE